MTDPATADAIRLFLIGGVGAAVLFIITIATRR